MALLAIDNVCALVAPKPNKPPARVCRGAKIASSGKTRLLLAMLPRCLYGAARAGVVAILIHCAGRCCRAIQLGRAVANQRRAAGCSNLV